MEKEKHDIWEEDWDWEDIAQMYIRYDGKKYTYPFIIFSKYNKEKKDYEFIFDISGPGRPTPMGNIDNHVEGHLRALKRILQSVEKDYYENSTFLDDFKTTDLKPLTIEFINFDNKKTIIENFDCDEQDFIDPDGTFKTTLTNKKIDELIQHLQSLKN